LTGMLAWQALTPETRRQVRALRPGDDFVELTTLMDRKRAELMHRYPGSPAWHYVRRQVCAPAEPPVCPRKHCANLQIERWRTILADRTAPAEHRADALAFLVHLIGDIHQPLHAASHHDRGGNTIRVSGPDLRSQPLHRAWDSALVERALGKSTQEDWVAQARVIHPNDRSGTIDDWIDESARLAREVIYQGLPDFNCQTPMPVGVKVDDDWIEHGVAVASERLVLAGARIAAVLNQALDPDNAAPRGDLAVP